jgi:ribosome-associated protein
LSEQPTNESEPLALSLAQIIDEKQGTDITILDVSAPLGIADYFVIASARNGRHANALARSLDLTMKHQGMLRRHLAGMEGESGWILLDFNTVVVHVFSPEAREFYGLENLWADVPRVAFTPVERPPEQDEGWLPEPEESYPDSIGNL